MREFQTYHPSINFLYFIMVILFSCLFMHPLCIAASLVSGILYSAMTGGRRALKYGVAVVIPALILPMVINPLFNHAGVTILGYFPNSNPFTLESVIYGIASGGMLASVICHCLSYGRIMTSDKFIYLSGRLMPSLSLVLSMTLRFVPELKKRFAQAVAAQLCVGRSITKGRLGDRLKNAVRIMGIMITWALEGSIVTADSMRSRGYGLDGRTAYSDYTFDKRDFAALLYITGLGAYIIIGAIKGCIGYSYFPKTGGAETGIYSTSVFLAYLLFCIMPIIIEISEAIRWSILRRKI